MTRKKKQQAEAAAEADVAPATPPGTGAGFSDSPPPASSPTNRITPIDIQQKVFRSSVRGYHEREVDQFLDEVTEELARLLAETRSLREQLERAEMRPTARFGADADGAAELEDSRVQAARTLAEAREEAARVVAEARSEAVVILEAAAAEAGRPSPSGAAVSGAAAGAAMAAGGGRAPDRDFIHREREFLQAMASLIQDHAEAIRDDLRRVRGEPPLEDGQDELDAEDAAPAEAPNAAGGAGAGALAAAEAASADDAPGSPVEAETPSAGAEHPVGESDVEQETAHDDVIDLAAVGAHEEASAESQDAEGFGEAATETEAAGAGSAEDVHPEDPGEPPVFGTATSEPGVAGEEDGGAEGGPADGGPAPAERAWNGEPEGHSDAGDDGSGAGAAAAPWHESEAAEPPPTEGAGWTDDASEPGTSGGEPAGYAGQAGEDAGPKEATPMAAAGTGAGAAAMAGDDADDHGDDASHPAAVGAALGHQGGDAAQAGQESETPGIGGPPPGWAKEPDTAHAAGPGTEDDEDEAGGRSLRELFWGED